MKKLVMAGKKMQGEHEMVMAGKKMQVEHGNRGTFTGELGERVEVNFTVEQKAKLVEKAAAIGMPLAVYIRMAALRAVENE